MRESLSRKLLEEKSRIQRLVDEAIEAIQRCNPKLLLPIASCRVLTYKLQKIPEKDELKWRSIEFIQNILVTHKIKTHECSMKAMIMDCFSAVEKVENIYEEMLLYTLFYNEILRRTVPNDNDRSLLVDAQTMYIVRGKRDVSFHKRYFPMMLASQDDNFSRFYGVTSKEVVDGILKLIDVLFDSKVNVFLALNSQFRTQVEVVDDKELPKLLESSTRAFWEELSNISAFDVEKITGWPKNLISDLSLPVASEDMPATHDYQFWPIGDSNIKDKPFIILDGKSYCFDYYTISDNIYHALFNLCRAKDCAYGHLWSDAQTIAIENGVADVLANLLPGTTILRNVKYFPTGKAGESRELDVVAICSGMIIVVETKGIEYINKSPILNPRKILEFYLNSAKKAGSQTRKFLDFIESRHTKEIKFFNVDGDVVFVADKTELGQVVRICVIADATNEILACTKKLKAINTDADGLICLSLDDLLIYEKYFESTPMRFIAYLQERDKAARLDAVTLSDELDHLGLYICEPNYVQSAKSRQNNCTMIALDDNRRNLDDFFNSLRNPKIKKPVLYLPPLLDDLMNQVWRSPARNKLQIASLVTGLEKLEKDWLADAMTREIEMQRSLRGASIRNCPSAYSNRGSGISLLIRTAWVSPISADDWMMRVRAAMIKFNEPSRTVLILDYDPSGSIVDASTRALTSADFNPALNARAKEFIEKIDGRVAAKIRKIGQVGRNELCPCGSGRKYKRCCGQNI